MRVVMLARPCMWLLVCSPSVVLLQTWLCAWHRPSCVRNPPIPLPRNNKRALVPEMGRVRTTSADAFSSNELSAHVAGALSKPGQQPQQ